MRKRPPLLQPRRKHLWPVLVLAYALLIQSILGPTVAGAHAFAMAQHEALGLATLCADGSGTPTAPVNQKQSPDGDCFACKIACTASFGVAALPAPEAAVIHIASLRPWQAPDLLTDDRAPTSARYKSDLASRAPPAILI